MTHLRCIAGFIRRRVEGFAFLLLVVVLAPALAGHVAWHGARRTAVAELFRRWGTFIAHGLKPLREAWWDALRFESQADLWRHVIALEVACIMNLRKTETSPRWSGALTERPRILVIKLAHIGDTLHVFPMLESLRAQRPGAVIDLLVGPWTEKLVRKFRTQNETLVYAPHFCQFDRGNRSARRGLLSEIVFLCELRRRRYDLVISTSSTQIVETMLITYTDPAFWIGADVPVDFYSTATLARTVPYDSRRYEAERVSSLLELVNLAPGDASLRFPLLDSERDSARTAVGPSSSYAVIAPGAGWPGKIWPAERFAELGDWANAELGCTTVLVGSRDEQPLASAIAGRMKVPPVNLAGRTSLDEMAALMERADLFIGNDSSPLHFATAFHTPSVALFGPTVASKWAPPSACVLQHEQCEGCLSWHYKASCIHDGRCMKAITVDEVKDAVRRLRAAPNNRNLEKRHG